MVIDAGFTRADALRIAANVLDSGKQLTTIYVSQADPDYYFGVETLKEIFPKADVVTTPAVLDKLNPSWLASSPSGAPRWAPTHRATPVLPRPLEGNTLSDGRPDHRDPRHQGLLAHRPYAWIPSIKAVVGNIGVFGNMHVWTADTQTPAERSGLGGPARRDGRPASPTVVVPGHMPAGTPLDARNDRLHQGLPAERSRRRLPATKTSAELIDAMKQAYPAAARWRDVAGHRRQGQQGRDEVVSSMNLDITYLFDPLCGWCYGASPTIGRLAAHDGVRLALAPTGLFAGSGARTMNADFAAFAWSNDQRIEKLSGQRFTEAYRQQILGQRGGRFDSSLAQRALTAVGLTEPAQELATLAVLQEARYVYGLDITDVSVVAPLLRAQGLDAAADRLEADDQALQQVERTRVERAQDLMRRLGAQGVPTLAVHGAKGTWMLRGDVLYGPFDALLEKLAAA